MYIDYSKLWKLLIDKNMSRTDLIALTGISSRVLAKLSKNETVTTETICRICSALCCDVGDIMECVSEERLSVYAACQKYGECTAENERYKTIRFTMTGHQYTVYQSRQTATKATHIHCHADGAVYWEQFSAIGYVAAVSEKTLLIKPVRGDDEIVIVLIKGKPAVIAGLDENGFVSSRGMRKDQSDIYVMSEAAFKLFSPSELDFQHEK